MFTQSNLGVVTQAGIWLMPEPETYNSFVFEMRDERHLPQVLDAFRQLALSGIVNTKLHMINDFVSLTVVTQRIGEQVPQDGPLSDADLATLRREYRYIAVELRGRHLRHAQAGRAATFAAPRSPLAIRAPDLHFGQIVAVPPAAHRLVMEEPFLPPPDRAWSAHLAAGPRVSALCAQDPAGYPDRVLRQARVLSLPSAPARRRGPTGPQ